MNTIGFDTDRYIAAQLKDMRTLLRSPSDRLYIEVGGKLIQDRHSARVLPGYREDARFEILKALNRISDVVLVVSAKDVLRGRIRGDFNISYDKETLRTIDELRKRGLPINHVAISLLSKGDEDLKEIKAFERLLKKTGVVSYHFFASKNYEHAESLLEDLEQNPFVSVFRKLVFVVSPGGGSGKFGICLSQLYHEMKRGHTPRYVTFGGFPMYDLPRSHPLNLAYMAALADFGDSLREDPLSPGSILPERELINFNLLRQLSKAFGKEGKYLRAIRSATDMCVSVLSKGIVNEETVAREAAAEIARRLMRYKFEVAKGKEDEATLLRVKEILMML